MSLWRATSMINFIPRARARERERERGEITVQGSVISVIDYQWAVYQSDSFDRLAALE